MVFNIIYYNSYQFYPTLPSQLIPRPSQLIHSILSYHLDLRWTFYCSCFLGLLATASSTLISDMLSSAPLISVTVAFRAPFFLSAQIFPVLSSVALPLYALHSIFQSSPSYARSDCFSYWALPLLLGGCFPLTWVLMWWLETISEFTREC